jgi:ribonucleoside-triphosphate reductase
MDPLRLVEDYLKGEGWELSENSNVTYSLQGLQFHLAREAVREYWLSKVYPPETAQAHRSGDLHLHDLQVLAPYCCGWDLLDLLQRGFGGPRGQIQSRPPRHFSSALGQIVNFLYTLQGEAAGAQAFSNFDTLLAPFVRADGLSYQQVFQHLQEFVYNLNVPTRLGFQPPFTNLTLDLLPPAEIAAMPAVVGGEVWDPDLTYADFGPERELINRALIAVFLEGDSVGRPFTFPIPTYSLTPDFPWDADYLQGLFELTAKYGSPYFANFINSGLSPDEVRSMCCHLRLDLSQLKRRGGGYFAANPLTGSIGVVTLNLPRAAYLARDQGDFLAHLGSLADLAREALVAKRAALETWMDSGLYPYSKIYLAGVKKRFGQYFKNHFATIGVVGMHEACLNLLGQGIETEAGRELASQSLDFLRARLLDYQSQTGDLFNLEATPAEGASYRLTDLDRQNYPAMPALAQIGERCYTNSTQLPVEFTDDPFFALDHQDQLQTRYTGGTVLHFFLGERPQDVSGLKSFIKKVASGWRLPYFTITPTASICPVHGYLNGEVAHCPYCGQETEIYSRVVGYLRPTAQWNLGKRAEFSRRRSFKI